MRTFRFALVVAPAVWLLLGAVAQAAPTRFFVVVRNVDEAAGVKSGIASELKALFESELKKHAELTLEPPAGLPTDPEAMSEELKKRKLKAYEMTLKVQGITREVKPPPPGKQFQVLVRGIKLSVFGNTLPEKVVAIGGDGESEAGAEVDRGADLDKEGKALLLDVSKDAIRQAVDLTVTKLKLAANPKLPVGKKKH